MNCLDLIHKNNTGAVYALKSLGSVHSDFNKVQLQIGEFAILLETEELQPFLQVVKTAKNKCECGKCGTNSAYKIIKCDTQYAQIKIKATSLIIADLEELMQSVIYTFQVDNILNINNINVKK